MITRRQTLRLLALCAAWPQLACRRGEGPEAIHYDRDTCEICNMIISDPRFAAQVRDPHGNVHKFDDIGDAIHWIARQPWFEAGQRPREIWVMNMEDGKTWLDARKAWYVPGQITPMDYGFGAMPRQRPGALSFEEMRRQVVARGLSSRCEDPLAHARDPAHDTSPPR